MDTEILAIAQEESDAQELGRIETFVLNDYPLVADPEQKSVEVFKRYGAYVVNRAGVVCSYIPGRKSARPRLDMILKELKSLKSEEASSDEAAGVRPASDAGASFLASMAGRAKPSPVKVRWMWSHDKVAPGDSFRLAILPMIAPGKRVLAPSKQGESLFQVTFGTPPSLELERPLESPIPPEAAAGRPAWSRAVPLPALRFKVSPDATPGKALVTATLHYRLASEPQKVRNVSFSMTIPIVPKGTRTAQVIAWRRW